MKKTNIIIRYNALERINHWIVAISFILLALSGLGFLFPSFNWLMNIFGTPQLARLLHPFFGVLMFLAFIIMFLRYWRHNLIKRGELIWAKKIHKVLQNQEVGDVGRYNLGQKGVFWMAIFSLLLLLSSGLIIWRPWFAPYFPIPLIRAALLVHSLAAVMFIMVIMVHIYAAVWWIKGSVTAMVEGWVTEKWAKKHHPRWYRELKQEKEKLSE